MSKLIVSASGVRGIVGDSLTPDVATHIGSAFGQFLGQSGTVIVGADTRVSGSCLSAAVISGLTSVGIHVLNIGQVPTPTVQQLIRHHQAIGGVVVTASHNPAPWNGLKLMNRSGSFLDDDEYAQYMATYSGEETVRYQAWDGVGQVEQVDNALDIHIDQILNHLDTRSLKQTDLRVLIDANNGAGTLADPKLLDRLGVDYHILNGEPTGRFAHDPEPVQGNLSQLTEAMKTGNYDIGFAQDADADRLVIVDENGRFIGEDYSLAFCMDYLLSLEPESTPKTIVVNLSTSQVIAHIANAYQAKLVYTKIGETHVSQAIKHHQAQVGGEGNGGIIYPKIGWGRDSLVGIVTALLHLAERKKTVSEIVDQYPRYTLIRDKFKVDDPKAVSQFIQQVDNKFPDADKNRLDGLKLGFENAWIHVRPSNTEPIVRVFVEAPNETEAKSLLAQVRQ